MLDYEDVEKFAEYIDNNGLGSSWVEKGLIVGTPPEAVEQFEQYKSYILEMEKQGIDV
jgi:hypothetical protein